MAAIRLAAPQVIGGLTLAANAVGPAIQARPWSPVATRSSA